MLDSDTHINQSQWKSVSKKDDKRKAATTLAGKWSEKHEFFFQQKALSRKATKAPLGQKSVLTRMRFVDLSCDTLMKLKFVLESLQF